MENSLGIRWQEGVNTLVSDVSDAQKIFQNYEDEASRTFLELRDKTVPEIVKNCIERGRATFSVPVPFYLVDTQAYRDFREWASSQSLTVQVIGRFNDDIPEEQNELVLMFLPQ